MAPGVTTGKETTGEVGLSRVAKQTSKQEDHNKASLSLMEAAQPVGLHGVTVQRPADNINEAWEYW